MAQFINAYNFVSLPKKKAVQYQDTDRHTGVITYKITTKTPLFIPNSSSNHAFAMEKDVDPEHQSYDFYSYCERREGETYENAPVPPVIPGSELRGLVRGIYETLTDSCMGVLNEEEIPVKRTSEVFTPALLRRTEAGGLVLYELVKAEDCIYRENADKEYKTYRETTYREGQKLYFKKINIKGKPLITECVDEKDEWHPTEGYLIKGMSDRDLDKKRHAHIFIPQLTDKKNINQNTSYRLDQNDLQRLEGVLKSYQSQPEAEDNCYQEYEKALKDFQNGEGESYFPVYYSLIEGKKNLLYLAPACYTKELSHHSIGELAGVLAPCKDDQVLCPACDLFGRVGDSNETTHASKIRFADAYPEITKPAGEYYQKPITLETLSSPKLSNTDFYLHKPENADFWTYDYYTVNGMLYIQPGKLRGRKYYWHQPGVQLPDGIEKSKLNRTVRPVKEEETFTGKVYFEKISNRQLEQLLWILNCGKENSGLAYKLGGGKPLGLGSIQCRVSEVKERRIRLDKQGIVYEDLMVPVQIQEYEDLGFSPSVREEFEALCSYQKRTQQISYPVTEEQLGRPAEEGFQWYVANHRAYKLIKGLNQLDLAHEIDMPNRRVQMKTIHALPLATEVVCMPCGHIKKEKDSQVKGNQSLYSSRKSENRGVTGTIQTPTGKTPKPGERFQATVTGYREKYEAIQYLEIQLNSGKRTTIHAKTAMGRKASDDEIRKSFPVGLAIQVEYTGTTKGSNGKLYDNYKYTNR